MSKRRAEKNLHAYNARDRMVEEQEKQKLEKEREFNKDWSEENRSADFSLFIFAKLVVNYSLGKRNELGTGEISK